MSYAVQWSMRAFAICVALSVSFGCKASEPTKIDTAEAQPTAVAKEPANKKQSKLDVPMPLRRVLEPMMLEHGDNLESLMWSALMIDHGSTEKIAGWLATPSAIARPPKGDLETLNAALPAEFYTLQDELQKAAEELRDVSARGDDAGLADSLGKVVSTCVRCHALFKPKK